MRASRSGSCSLRSAWRRFIVCSMSSSYRWCSAGKPFGDQVRNGLLCDLLYLHAGVADGGALILARQKAGTPVVGSAMAERRLDGDEAGQVLILGSEPVQDPRAHARAFELEHAGVELQQRGAMIHAIADHGADYAEVVDAGGDVGEKVADRDAALAVLLELPGRFHQSADIVFAEGQAALEGDGLAVVFVEARLWDRRYRCWTGRHA